MFDQDAEIDFILWLQEHVGWLEPIMVLFTWLGIPTVLVMTMAIFYWCIDYRLGLRFGLFVYFFGAVNDLLKQTFRSPRPFWVSAEVATFGEGTSSSFAMPSGHAQTAPVWFLVAERLGTTWARVLATVAIILIGFSRVFLGVHSPSQVLVGWAFGLAFMIAFLWLEARFAAAFFELGLARQVGAVMVSAATMLVLGWLVTTARGQFEAPADWLANVETESAAQGEALDPAGLRNVAATITAYATTAVGALLLRSSGQDRPATTVRQRLLRLPVGLTIVVAALVLTVVVNNALGGDNVGDTLGVIQAMISAFLALGAIVFMAPIAFNRLGLSVPEKPDEARPGVHTRPV